MATILQYKEKPIEKARRVKARRKSIREFVMLVAAIYTADLLVKLTVWLVNRT